MSRDQDFYRRLGALLAHPLSRRSMNSGHMGGMGTLLDISVEPGWLSLVEDMYRHIEARVPPEDWPVIDQIKEKWGVLEVYHGADDDSTAAVIIETAMAASLHRCQVCGKRGRLQQGGWLATLCEGHWYSRDGAGEDWPKLPVLLHIRGGAVLYQGCIHGFQDATLGPWSASSRASMNRQLDEEDAVVIALSPAVTMAQLDCSVFAGGGIQRSFESVPARTVLETAAHEAGMSPTRLMELVEQLQKGDDEGWRAAGYKLSALLAGRNQDKEGVGP